MEVKLETVEKNLIKQEQNKIKESLLKAIKNNEFAKIINLKNNSSNN